MRAREVSIVAAGLVLAFSARTAVAQCAFDHPKKAKLIKVTLVQAFIPCGGPGGNSPNGSTESGFPSCAPPESYVDFYAVGNGWRWDPASSEGQLQLKSGPNKIVDPLNPPGNTDDVAITLALEGVHDLIGGGLASGTGLLRLVLRWTMNDRLNGDMTVAEQPFDFYFPLSGGSALLETSVNAFLNGGGQPGLPPCTNLELVSAVVHDENLHQFARAGLWLP